MRKLEIVLLSEVCISAVVESELRFGVEISPRRRKDQEALEALLRFLPVIDFPAAAAIEYGRIRSDLQRRGLLIGGNDLLIAAHARCLGLTLVTNKMREFGRVAGLKLENWA